MKPETIINAGEKLGRALETGTAWLAIAFGATQAGAAIWRHQWFLAFMFALIIAAGVAMRDTFKEEHAKQKEEAA